MRCTWELRRDATTWLRSGTPDQQYVAALAAGAGLLDAQYDPADSSDPGNAEVLAPPAPGFRRPEGTKVPGGRVYAAYEREPGQEATLRIMFARSGSVTTYSATRTASGMGLYTCGCCAGLSRQIMQSAEAALISNANGQSCVVRPKKGSLTLIFKTDSPKAQFRINLVKQRPAKTIGYYAPGASRRPQQPYPKEARGHSQKVKNRHYVIE